MRRFALARFGFDCGFSAAQEASTPSTTNSQLVAPAVRLSRWSLGLAAGTVAAGALAAWPLAFLAPSGAAIAEAAAFNSASDRMMSETMGSAVAYSGDADRDFVMPSGDADADFVKMVTPIAQEAIAIDDTELQYGTDASLRALAQAVIAADTTELAAFNIWLKAHG